MPNYLDREKQRLHQERGQQMVARFNQAFVNPLAQYAQAVTEKRLLGQIQATQGGINDWISDTRNGYVHWESSYPEYTPADIIHALDPNEQIRALYTRLLTIPAGTGIHPVGLPHLLQSLGFVVEIVPDFFSTNLTWQKILQKRWADLHERKQYTTRYRIEQADKVVTITIATPSSQPNNFADATTTASIDPFADWSDGQNSPTATQRRLDFFTAIASTPQSPSPQTG